MGSMTVGGRADRSRSRETVSVAAPRADDVVLVGSPRPSARIVRAARGRGLVAAAVVAVVLALAAPPVTGQGPAAPDDPTTTSAPVPPPAASIVVDAGNGRVIMASDARRPRSPASATKLLTALLVRERLELDAEITVPGAVASAPARRLDLVPGSRVRVRDLLYATIHCSCNDAAWALGLAAGDGMFRGYSAHVQALARELGLADEPVLRDPAGLDDASSIGGGNLMSARDLAIVARAFLADPELAAIAAAPSHGWVGGDGRRYVVANLNGLLGRYQGAVGLKTGFTKKAGLTFVAAARRDGRTLIAVVLDSDAHYAHARELLDRGFVLAGAGEGTGDRLPALPDARTSGAEPDVPTTTTTSAPAPSTPDPGSSRSPSSGATSVPSDSTGPSGPPSEDGSTDERWWLGAGGGAVALGAGLIAVAGRRRGAPSVPRRRPRRRRRRRRRRHPS